MTNKTSNPTDNALKTAARASVNDNLYDDILINQKVSDHLDGLDTAQLNEIAAYLRKRDITLKKNYLPGVVAFKVGHGGVSNWLEVGSWQVPKTIKSFISAMLIGFNTDFFEMNGHSYTIFGDYLAKQLVRR